jgi:hypothetical protein
MSFYACGTRVKCEIAPIAGMITQISLRFEKIAYEITYFDSGEFKTTWMNEKEFSVVGTTVEKTLIGFK